jgi:hypothetical protein
MLLLSSRDCSIWTPTAPGSFPPARHKVEIADVTAALAAIGPLVRHNDLPQRIMNQTHCSKRTAQLAIAEACRI